MQEITTIGLDIAKSAFQVHGIDARHKFNAIWQTLAAYPSAGLQRKATCLF